MIIAGTYDGYLITKCCKKGKWKLTYVNRGSGSFSCEHKNHYGNFDYLDMSKLKEVIDEKIIEEISFPDKSIFIEF